MQKVIRGVLDTISHNYFTPIIRQTERDNKDEVNLNYNIFLHTEKVIQNSLRSKNLK